jgi:hypothetical protein
MNSHQNCKLNLLSSITVGIMAFCVTACVIMPLVLLVGGILLGPQQEHGHAFF